MDKKHHGEADKSENRVDREQSHDEENARHGSSKENPNPPRTTSKGWMTTPKFGSSTSGGGEIEPGPERD